MKNLQEIILKECENDGDMNYTWRVRYSLPKDCNAGSRTWKSEDELRPSNYFIDVIGHNIKKGPGDMRWYAVAKTSNGKPSANAGGNNS